MEKDFEQEFEEIKTVIYAKGNDELRKQGYETCLSCILLLCECSEPVKYNSCFVVRT